MNRKIYNEACSNKASAVKGTGSDCEALESVATMYFLTREDFKATIEDMKDLAIVNNLILEGQIVPMFDMYEVDAANTDAEVYETGNFSAETKKASKGMTFEHYLGFCSHDALKSYEESGYTRYIEVTDEGYLLGVRHTDGESFTGELMKSFEVGMRMKATSAKPPYTTVTIKFDDYEESESGAIHLKPDYNPNVDIKGVFEAYFEFLEHTGGTKSGIIRAMYGCSGTPVSNLSSPTGDFVLHIKPYTAVTDNNDVEICVMVVPLTYDQETGNYSYEFEVDPLYSDNGMTKHSFWIAPSRDLVTPLNNIGKASIDSNGKLLKFSGEPTMYVR